ncbi:MULTISPECIES: hypothetical protein [Tenacibaculum]|uniref:GlsB/YeaQ/YmgE family stress response membrane protein n=1 Tax=Tenacibaculum discolor TaxID=361581 RepID=A0A2G1BVL6_9FLAO|nr:MULTISPECIES: hypothetical protein [Tenacibaculum]PHO00914.1 hypothetical protein CSC82_26355 [Rhodobacteraceae bacterium 4F10]MDP2540143.1 hypothetical protein [Tenacibaculum discolor]NVK08244.1 hypothetical protein [Tenacibaculum sp.]PHN98091.1 hypothetical protein CSC81_06720 [Tenacibaculum discolor]RLK03178.1 hypothetical protein C8N27_1027 [Tenacibaculum discolor]
MEFLISLLSGAVGGNLAGALLKKFSLGTIWNSVVGILGGGLGAQLLGMLNVDISGIIGNIAASGVGGAVLLVIVGVIKSAMAKS